MLEILRKTKDREIPTHPPSNIPRRKYTSVLGTMTIFQKKRDEQKEEQISEHDQNCRQIWQKREDSGKGSLLSDMQQPGKRRKIDTGFINRKIKCLTDYTVKKNDGSIGIELRWCGALVEAVSDGTWARTGRNGKRLKTMYKVGEAAQVFWDAVEETGEPAQRQLIELKPGMWNGNEAGAWRLQLDSIDYGIKD